MIEYEGAIEDFILFPCRSGHCDNIDISEISFRLPLPTLLPRTIH